MESTVIFRDFEERDIDFIYRCKNDEKLNSMIVGQFRPFSREDAENWVHGCMGEHETYKFWAIATNDEEKKIVGWTALSSIDRENQKACLHGIVIGDEIYQDGFAWMETYLFVFKQTFEVYGLNRLYGTHLSDHKTSALSMDLFFWTHEGTLRKAICKNGVFHDLNYTAILNEDYEYHKALGDYDFSNILKRLRKLRKQQVNNA